MFDTLFKSPSSPPSFPNLVESPRANKYPKYSFYEKRTVANKEYEARAEELGFRPTAIRTDIVTEALSEIRVPRYDLKEVTEYMNKIVPQGKIWVWKPLRQQDTQEYKYGERNGDYDTVSGSYDHLIPLHILKRVKAIETQLGKHGVQPQFYVTDYSVPNPDPFIMFRTNRSGEKYIFGVWDEPAFEAKNVEV